MKNNYKYHPDVDAVLLQLTQDIQQALQNNLLGLYLFGSLSYGDFKPESSDIDLVAIVKEPLTSDELQLVQALHKQIAAQYPRWEERVECSYTPIGLFENIIPPKEPRPYYGGGIFYAQAPYGNEWIINNYLLYKHSIPLIGADFKTLIKPVAILEVQKASVRDLFQEWEPKIADRQWLANSHYQSYLVLNLCRILYTVLTGVAGTKKVSAEWVKTNFPQWRDLITQAQVWQYDKEMQLQDQAIDFIKFTITKIKSSDVYKQMS
jgi:predicted nucleotidyltransferase